MPDGDELGERAGQVEPGLGLAFTDVAQPGAAGVAGPAGAHKRHGDPVPDRPAGDLWAEFGDRAGVLMAADVGESNCVVVPGPGVQVRAAQPGGLHGDDGPVGWAARVRDIADRGELAELVVDQGTHACILLDGAARMGGGGVMARTDRPDRSLDRSVRERLGLPRGERSLAWAKAEDDSVWVGTRAALYVPEAAGYRRVRWARIDRADWNDATQQLRVVELAGFGEVMPRSVARLHAADRLLQLVRERVTASVVALRTVPLRDRLGVRVIARRDPEGSTELTWSAVLDAGLDPSDPQVLADAEAALARVRAEVGLDE